MGQAKHRGSRDERVAQGIERRLAEAKARQQRETELAIAQAARERERRRAMTEAQRERDDRRRHNQIANRAILAGLVTAAAMLTLTTPPRSRYHKYSDLEPD